MPENFDLIKIAQDAFRESAEKARLEREQQKSKTPDVPPASPPGSPKPDQPPEPQPEKSPAAHALERVEQVMARHREEAADLASEEFGQYCAFSLLALENHAQDYRQAYDEITDALIDFDAAEPPLPTEDAPDFEAAVERFDTHSGKRKGYEAIKATIGAHLSFVESLLPERREREQHEKQAHDPLLKLLKEKVGLNDEEIAQHKITYQVITEVLPDREKPENYRCQTKRFSNYHDAMQALAQLPPDQRKIADDNWWGKDNYSTVTIYAANFWDKDGMDNEQSKLYPHREEIRKLYAQLAKGSIPDTYTYVETKPEQAAEREIVPPSLVATLKEVGKGYGGLITQGEAAWAKLSDAEHDQAMAWVTAATEKLNGAEQALLAAKLAAETEHPFSPAEHEQFAAAMSQLTYLKEQLTYRQGWLERPRFSPEAGGKEPKGKRESTSFTEKIDKVISNKWLTPVKMLNKWASSMLGYKFAQEAAGAGYRAVFGKGTMRERMSKSAGDLGKFIYGGLDVKDRRTKLDAAVEEYLALSRDPQAYDDDERFAAAKKMGDKAHEVKQLIKGATYLPADEQQAYRDMLAKILWEQHHRVELEQDKFKGRLEQVSGVYIHNKALATVVARDALNTALVLGGGTLLRVGSYAATSVAERALKTAREWQQAVVRGVEWVDDTGKKRVDERGRSADAGFGEVGAHALKRMVVDTAVETGNALAFRGKHERLLAKDERDATGKVQYYRGRKFEVSWKHAADFAGAFGNLATATGLGTLAAAQFSDHGQALDKLNDALQHSLEERGLAGTGLHNFVTNAERMGYIYTHPGESLQAWGNTMAKPFHWVGGKVNDFLESRPFGGGGSSEVAASLAPEFYLVQKYHLSPEDMSKLFIHKLPSSPDYLDQFSQALGQAHGPTGEPLTPEQVHSVINDHPELFRIARAPGAEEITNVFKPGIQVPLSGTIPETPPEQHAPEAPIDGTDDGGMAAIHGDPELAHQYHDAFAQAGLSDEQADAFIGKYGLDSHHIPTQTELQEYLGNGHVVQLDTSTHAASIAPSSFEPGTDDGGAAAIHGAPEVPGQYHHAFTEAGYSDEQADAYIAKYGLDPNHVPNQAELHEFITTGKVADLAEHASAGQPAPELSPTELKLAKAGVSPEAIKVFMAHQGGKAPSDSELDKYLEKFTVQKGEGIERQGIDQIKDDPIRFGYRGDPANKAAVEAFADHMAHQAALNTTWGDQAVVEVKHGQMTEVRLQASAIGKTINLVMGPDGKPHYEFGADLTKADTYSYSHDVAAKQGGASQVPDHPGQPAAQAHELAGAGKGAGAAELHDLAGHGARVMELSAADFPPGFKSLNHAFHVVLADYPDAQGHFNTATPVYDHIEYEDDGGHILASYEIPPDTVGLKANLVELAYPKAQLVDRNLDELTRLIPQGGKGLSLLQEAKAAQLVSHHGLLDDRAFTSPTQTAQLQVLDKLLAGHSERLDDQDFYDYLKQGHLLTELNQGVSPTKLAQEYASLHDQGHKLAEAYQLKGVDYNLLRQWHASGHKLELGHLGDRPVYQLIKDNQVVSSPLTGKQFGVAFKPGESLTQETLAAYHQQAEMQYFAEQRLHGAVHGLALDNTQAVLNMHCADVNEVTLGKHLSQELFNRNTHTKLYDELVKQIGNGDKATLANQGSKTVGEALAEVATHPGKAGESFAAEAVTQAAATPLVEHGPAQPDSASTAHVSSVELPGGKGTIEVGKADGVKTVSSSLDVVQNMPLDQVKSGILADGYRSAIMGAHSQAPDIDIAKAEMDARTFYSQLQMHEALLAKGDKVGADELASNIRKSLEFDEKTLGKDVFDRAAIERQLNAGSSSGAASLPEQTSAKAAAAVESVGAGAGKHVEFSADFMQHKAELNEKFHQFITLATGDRQAMEAYATNLNLKPDEFQAVLTSLDKTPDAVGELPQFAASSPQRGVVVGELLKSIHGVAERSHNQQLATLVEELQRAVGPS